MAPWRLVVAEDNILVREGSVSLVATADDLIPVAVCSSLRELHEPVDRENPDVVVADIRMPPATHRDEGILAARRLGLTPHSVEKHSTTIFMKLGLAEDIDVNRRVKAVLMFLAGQHASGVS